MNKASGGDGISVELLQILKDDAVKVLHSVMEHSAIATGLQKVFFFFFLPPYQRKAMPKNAQIITQLHSSHTLVMLKILQARPQQYVNSELPEFKLVLEKAEEPEIKLPTSAGSSKKQESSRKASNSTLLTMPKPLTVWITINCGKF